MHDSLEFVGKECAACGKSYDEVRLCVFVSETG